MILHLTDTHFGTERAEVVRGLMGWARQHRPRLIVLSGDVTQRARPRQFGAARAFVDALCAASGIDSARDVLLLPGNHDIPLFNLPLRLLAPYGRYSRFSGAGLNPLIRRDDTWLIGVNTTRPWRHKHGEISGAQIERVAARLRAAPPGALRVVVTHQPLWVVQRQDRRDLARNHAAAARAWCAAGADLFLAGHIHQSFVAPMPCAPHRAWVVQTGTAVSTRVRVQVPNTMHVIDPHPPQTDRRATVWRWDWNGHAFARVAETAIPG
ncbi:MAG: metallophosphoesterase [Pseudomonadota bacterium]|nr:metallophosphoesterase [Pseudomonadota bacterium]